MFTGIIQDIGTIEAIDTKGDWTVTIAAPAIVPTLSIGASVCCDGVCLTVISANERQFVATLSPETLSKTTTRWWHIGSLINLERSLRMGDELGGHMVSGHVDGLARIVSCEEDKDSMRYVFEVPDDLAGYIAPKGSIALDGISLTINEVDGVRFGVNIIPHTQTATTIGQKKPGDLMNVEIDMIARYVGRFLEAKGIKL